MGCEDGGIVLKCAEYFFVGCREICCTYCVKKWAQDATLGDTREHWEKGRCFVVEFCHAVPVL